MNAPRMAILDTSWMDADVNVFWAGKTVGVWGRPSQLDGVKQSHPSSYKELDEWCEALARKVTVKRDWHIGNGGELILN